MLGGWLLLCYRIDSAYDIPVAVCLLQGNGDTLAFALVIFRRQKK